MKRIALVVLLLALIVVVSACSSTRPLTVTSEIASPKNPIHSERGQGIHGYTKIDGVHYKFRGRVRLLSADTLEFYDDDPHRPAPPYELRRVDTFRVPADSVQTIMTDHFEPAATAMLAVPVFVFGYIVIMFFRGELS